MSKLFDDHPELYEELVDWPMRLANEGPFYRTIFDVAGVRRVLDVPCGSGHHGALFSQWGMEGQRVDVSSQMIELCRRRHGDFSTLR